MRSLRFLLLGSILFSPACGNEDPTGPTPVVPVAVGEIFTGNLPARATKFYSFTVDSTANVGLTLISVRAGSSGAVLSTPLSLGLGVPSGTGCGVTSSTTATPALVPQVGTVLNAGIYCAALADTGTLAEDINFLVRIVIVPAGVSFTGSAKNDTFATTLTPQGVVTKTFTATLGGPLSLTLQSAGPPSDVVLGLGIGMWLGGETGCVLSRTLNTTAGSVAQIATTADPGTYCVRVSDATGLSGPIAFTVAIAYQ